MKVPQDVVFFCATVFFFFIGFLPVFLTTKDPFHSYCLDELKSLLRDGDTDEDPHDYYCKRVANSLATFFGLALWMVLVGGYAVYFVYQQTTLLGPEKYRALRINVSLILGGIAVLLIVVPLVHYGVWHALYKDYYLSDCQPGDPHKDELPKYCALLSSAHASMVSTGFTIGMLGLILLFSWFILRRFKVKAPPVERFIVKLVAFLMVLLFSSFFYFLIWLWRYSSEGDESLATNVSIAVIILATFLGVCCCWEKKMLPDLPADFKELSPWLYSDEDASLLGDAPPPTPEEREEQHV